MGQFLHTVFYARNSSLPYVSSYYVYKALRGGSLLNRCHGMYKILSCHHNGNLLMHGKLLLFPEGKNENIEDIFVQLSNKNICEIVKQKQFFCNKPVNFSQQIFFQ